MQKTVSETLFSGQRKEPSPWVLAWKSPNQAVELLVSKGHKACSLLLFPQICFDYVLVPALQASTWSQAARGLLVSPASASLGFSHQGDLDLP